MRSTGAPTIRECGHGLLIDYANHLDANNGSRSRFSLGINTRFVSLGYVEGPHDFDPRSTKRFLKGPTYLQYVGLTLDRMTFDFMGKLA